MIHLKICHFFKSGGIVELDSNANWSNYTVDNERLYPNIRNNVESMYVNRSQQAKDKDGT